MAKAKAFGAVLQYNPGGWTPISQIVSIGDLVTADKGILDCTTHDSTGGYREKLSHLIEQPAFDVTIVFDPANTHHAYLNTTANSVSAAAEDFRIIMADSGATKWEFTCFVKAFQVNAQEVDGLLTATVTLEPTGAPDYSPV